MPPPPDLILVTTCHATQDTASAASCTPTPGTSCGCSKNIATRVYSVRGLKPSADVAKAFRAQLIQDVGHSAELPLLSLEIDTSRNVVKIQWHANDAPASMEVCPCCFCESGYEQCRGPGPLSHKWQARGHAYEWSDALPGGPALGVGDSVHYHAGAGRCLGYHAVNCDRRREGELGSSQKHGMTRVSLPPFRILSRT